MDDLTNLQAIEEKYAEYLRNRESVDPSWRYFFAGMEFVGKTPMERKEGSLSDLCQAYKRYGHLLANIDPIAPPPSQIPELALENFTLSPDEEIQAKVKKLQSMYCGKIGFECTDLFVEGLEEWIEKKIELGIPPATEEQRDRIAKWLSRSEIFENFLHTKYLGQTRFSLEGHDALIPMLHEIVLLAAEMKVKGFVLGMAHRGRLNVLTNILNKPYSTLFKEFEGTLPYLEGEAGDVKYHKGFSTDLQVGNETIHLHLSANSSSLESVDGIALGQTKALQIVSQDDSFGTILIHGDAAIAGQGVVYETLQMSRVGGFSTKGTLHIVLDNRIGYTTLPEEARSTRYCTDIAKIFGCPVFHVNGEDPEGCVWVARLALEIRQKFGCDVFINLHGYRKYGHNEGDEPSFTQPISYQIIRKKKSVRTLYLEGLGAEGSRIQAMGEAFEKELRDTLASEYEKGKVKEEIPLERRFGSTWGDFTQPSDATFFQSVETSVSEQTLKEVLTAYTKAPEGFHLHPKLVKWTQDRLAQLSKGIDWGAAECLSFGSLLVEGVPIRLAGQDVKRGTFSQRHAVWFDQTTGASYVPFMHLKEGQARFDVHNTILSEYGALAFEFGYSWSHPSSLTLWEAQYGDFDIGAQTIIDHYLVAAEQKWARYSSLVMLLPHGYEGAGPEHSSARMERFLQLSACNNIQVAYPSTPAQYFHLLRRQALRKGKKPLIVMTPKSLLRAPLCQSPLSAFTKGSFEEVLDDASGSSSSPALVFCSGKIYYDILGEKIEGAPIVRIEQLYPFHLEKFQAICLKYNKSKTWIWIQEEPENMGAWEFIRPYLAKHLPQGGELICIARPRSGSTATGSHQRSIAEQAAILQELKQRIHGR